jgi:hypothetical protein
VAEHASAASIPTVDLMQPADLAASLKSATAPKPLILQVGFRTLFTQTHIPDSEYVGAASEDAGLQHLRNRVTKLTKDTAIVIYCGCCPWNHCLNIAAAYHALHALGGVSMDDDAAPVKRAYEKYHLNYPVVMGDAQLGERFGGVLGLPLSYLIDPDGRVVGRYQGEPNLKKLESQIKRLLLRP